MDKKENVFRPEENESDTLKIVQALGGVIGCITIITAGCFFISIVNNMIYFYMFGISLYKVPLTIADYMLSFGSWGLFFISMALFNLLMSFFDFKFISACIGINYTHSLYGIEKCKKYINEKYLKNTLYLFKGIFYVFIIFNIVKVIIFDFSIDFYSFFMIILSFSMVFLIFMMMIMCGRARKIFIITIVYFIIMIITSMITMVNSRFSFKDKDSTITFYNKEYFLLRSFDNGFLAYDNNFDYIYFITKNNNIIKYNFPEYLKPENISNKENGMYIDKDMGKILKDSLSAIPDIR